MDSLIIKWQQRALVHYKQALTTAVGRKVQQGMGEVYEKCADELAAQTRALEVEKLEYDAEKNVVVFRGGEFKTNDPLVLATGRQYTAQEVPDGSENE